jgi:hypothetical protein
MRLQNIDGEMTAEIFSILKDDDIPCLGIHDSYIVPAEHEARLQQVMDDVLARTAEMLANNPALIDMANYRPRKPKAAKNAKRAAAANTSKSPALVESAISMDEPIQDAIVIGDESATDAIVPATMTDTGATNDQIDCCDDPDEAPLDWHLEDDIQLQFEIAHLTEWHDWPDDCNDRQQFNELQLIDWMVERPQVNRNASRRPQIIFDFSKPILMGDGTYF